MAKPNKSSPTKQKPTAAKKAPPKKNPPKAKPSKPLKPSKPSQNKSARAKPASQKHTAKSAVKTKAPKASKLEKPLVKKQPEPKHTAQKPTKPAKPARTTKTARPVKTTKPDNPGKTTKPAKPANPAHKTKTDRKHPAPPGGKHAQKLAREIKITREPTDKTELKTIDNKRDQLRKNILVGHKNHQDHKLAPFTLDEAREIAKQHAATAKKTEDDENASAKNTSQAKKIADKLAKAAAPTHVKAASLADILGFNPKRAKPAAFAPVESVPEKYRRYYKLLLDLRNSLTEGLTLHSEQTLRRSTKEDAGDLSSYGQHMADAGTDTFDRDFALSMVANEQEALAEIDAAIKRIQTATYGICEITQKPIAKDRLLAVPFTRYSAEAQKDLERNRMRVRTAAGLFGGEISDDATRVDDSGGGDE